MTDALQPKPDMRAVRMPNPEEGLTQRQITIRRQLMKSPRPVTDAAIEIARLRALKDPLWQGGGKGDD